ncbi:hypothetical protein F4779DRAFT_638924 [Xylariaceae sp. FL0662B]|nr:hypothetical protein F4779DRAFT_638924 [Xylariaceae sp. FL0662B]
MVSRLLVLLALALSATANPFLDTQSTLQLFLDFDGTIVTSDAYTTLASAAYESLPANGSIPSWDLIEATYGQVSDAVSATVPQPTSLREAIAYADNQALRAVEQWSFTWVQGLGVFDGVTADALVRQARNQTLRGGWCEFARAAQRRGVHIRVVSLNWSPAWIRLVLREATGCPEVAAHVDTYCPEILPPGVLPRSGRDHDEPLFSGGDKSRLVARLLARVPPARKQRVVFVSDGDADLQPLWGAPTNVGIVAGLGGSAAEAFRRYGVEIWNASEGWKGLTGEAASNRSAVYGFEDWRDIENFLWP